MQYLLSQEEYDALKNANRKEDLKQKRKLETFCHFVADNTPVIGWWNEVDGVPDPWGCRHTKIAVDKSDPNGYVDEYYCDECPCRDVCPSEQDYSK